MQFQLNRAQLPGCNPVVGWVLDNFTKEPHYRDGAMYWLLGNRTFGFGFVADLAKWFDLIIPKNAHPHVPNEQFSYHGVYLTAAIRLMEALDPEYCLQLSPSGLLFFVGATYFVVLAPIIGVGRDAESLFLSEILEAR